MSNVQWRRFRVQSKLLIDQMKLEQLPTEFFDELTRIEELLDQPDYISSTPMVCSQASGIDKTSLKPDVLNKYNEILELGKRFK